MPPSYAEASALPSVIRYFQSEYSLKLVPFMRSIYGASDYYMRWPAIDLPVSLSRGYTMGVDLILRDMHGGEMYPVEIKLELTYERFCQALGQILYNMTHWKRLYHERFRGDFDDFPKRVKQGFIVTNRVTKSNRFLPTEEMYRQTLTNIQPNIQLIVINDMDLMK